METTGSNSLETRALLHAIHDYQEAIRLLREKCNAALAENKQLTEELEAFRRLLRDQKLEEKLAGQMP